jgi:hypothetical protein
VDGFEEPSSGAGVTYSIKVCAAGVTPPSALPFGVVVSDNVHKLTFHYFTAVACPGTDWTVVVTPSSANDNPNLFVNYVKLNFPNFNVFDGGSLGSAGVEDQVVVSGVTAPTEVRIAVLGFSEPSSGAGVSFTIKVVPVSGVNTCDRDNDGVP